MKTLKRIAVLALVVAIAACGESNNVVEPSLSLVAGQWSYSATNLTGNVLFTCSISGATITLAQSGSVVTGSATGGTLSCVGPLGVTSQALSNGPITNITTSGTNVQFTFGSQNIQSNGTVAGDSIVGRVTLSGVLGTMAQLSGTFRAVRR